MPDKLKHPSNTWLLLTHAQTQQEWEVAQEGRKHQYLQWATAFAQGHAQCFTPSNASQAAWVVLPLPLLQLCLGACQPLASGKEAGSYYEPTEPFATLEGAFAQLQSLYPNNPQATLLGLTYLAAAALQRLEVPNFKAHWKTLAEAQAQLAAEEDTEPTEETPLQNAIQEAQLQAAALQVTYHSLSHQLDEAHSFLKQLKNKALNPQLPTLLRGQALRHWAEACADLGQTYSQKAQERELRLLYEDARFAAEQLEGLLSVQPQHQEALTSHALPLAVAQAKLAEALCWLHRNSHHLEASLRYLHALEHLCHPFPQQGSLWSYWLNATIAVGQSFGQQEAFDEALALWQHVEQLRPRIPALNTPMCQLNHMKLGLNVLWAYKPTASLSAAQHVFKRMQALAMPSEGLQHQTKGSLQGKQPMLMHELAWGSINLAWCYASHGKHKGIEALLKQLQHWGNVAPYALPCWQEAQAALLRNALWAIRGLSTAKRLTITEALQHQLLALWQQQPPTQASPYLQQQVLSALGQLWQYYYGLLKQPLKLPVAIKTPLLQGLQAWQHTLSTSPSPPLQQHALLQVHWQAVGHAITLAHALLLYGEEAPPITPPQQSNNPPLLQGLWEIFNTPLAQALEAEETPALSALAELLPHWLPSAALLSKWWGGQSNTHALAGLAQQLQQLHGLHPQLPTALVCAKTLLRHMQSLCQQGQWQQAPPLLHQLEQLVNQYAPAGSSEANPLANPLAKLYAQALTCLITQWPAHRDLSTNLPYIQTLLSLAKQHPNEPWWPSLLGQLRAYHCHCFYMHQLPQQAVAEMEALQHLAEKHRGHRTVQVSYLQALASHCQWQSLHGPTPSVEQPSYVALASAVVQHALGLAQQHSALWQHAPLWHSTYQALFSALQASEEPALQKNLLQQGLKLSQRLHKEAPHTLPVAGWVQGVLLAAAHVPATLRKGLEAFLAQQGLKAIPPQPQEQPQQQLGGQPESGVWITGTLAPVERLRHGHAWFSSAVNQQPEAAEAAYQALFKPPPSA
jgi:hypothetical protein